MFENWKDATMDATEPAASPLSGIVSGIGIGLLASLPSRAYVHDRSATSWGDYEQFEATEGQVLSGSNDVARMID